MKKKLQMILTGVMAVAMLLALAGCGGAAEEPAAEEETATEETAAEEETAETSELAEYKSNDGWAVKYDPTLIEVQDGGGAADFLYTGGGTDSADLSRATVSYEAGKQPEEVLYEITSTWGNDEGIERSEGFLPGTDSQWGYWRVLNAPEDNSAPARTAIAGEYNGGVILIQNVMFYTGDEAADMTAQGALETIVDSITYEDFQPQTMYEYIPGTYSAEQDGADNSITLNEDHTGVLSFQDDADIIWSSNELMAADGSFTYEYTIEGDNLMVNYDGEWMTFTK